MISTGSNFSKTLNKPRKKKHTCKLDLAHKMPVFDPWSTGKSVSGDPQHH